MPYTIHIFPRAMGDIRAAAIWKGRRSPVAGSRWHAGIPAAIRTLADNPHRCPRAEEAPDLGLDLRELLYGRRHFYRILFTIDAQTVNFLRVRHAAQDRLNSGEV